MLRYRALRSVSGQLGRACWQMSHSAAEEFAQRTAVPACLAASTRHESSQARLPLPTSTSAQAAVEKHLMVDTLDMARRFELMGISRDQAEELTKQITGILCTNKDQLASEYVSQTVLEKAVSEQDMRIVGVKTEVIKQYEAQEALFTRDIERLQANLEKVRSEIRYEIDKLTASQRLDLNLEKGRMRDEMQMIRDKTNELEIKLDKEVNSLKAAMEQSKSDTVKYVLGLMLALLTAALGAARLLMI